MHEWSLLCQDGFEPSPTGKLVKKEKKYHLQTILLFLFGLIVNIVNGSIAQIFLQTMGGMILKKLYKFETVLLTLKQSLM